MLPTTQVVSDALARLHKDTCTVYEMAEVKNPDGSTDAKLTPVLTDIACHLSYGKGTPAQGSDTATTTVQSPRLFLASGYTIKPGSRVLVKHEGRETEYMCSGEPEVYASHQAIPVTLADRYA